MQDLVSILITAYNEELYIKEAIDSCLSQTYENIEVIVFNDGSTDNTLKILESYVSYKNVKILTTSTNRGKVAGLNSCYSVMSGKYLHLMGADDVLLPECIEECINAMNNNNIDSLYHSIQIVDCNLMNLHKSLYLDNFNDLSLKTVVTKRIGVPSGSWFLKTTLAEFIFPIPSGIPYEDIWLDVTVKTFSKKVLGLDIDLYKYRQHSKNTFGLLNSTIRQVKWRLSRDKVYLDYIVRNNPFMYHDDIIKGAKAEIEIIDEIVNSKSIFDIAISRKIPSRIKLQLIFNSNKYLALLKNIIKRLYHTIYQNFKHGGKEKINKA